MQFSNLVLATGLLSVVLANDIVFYEINTCNSGAFLGCYGIGPGICCYHSDEDEAAAVSVTKGPLDFATMWSGGRCTVQECSAGGAGTFCCIWNGRNLLTGGMFVTLPGDALEDPQSAVECTSEMEANVFGYALGDNASWEIRQEDVGENFSELRQEFNTVPGDQKEAWLQTHGAVYSIRIHDGPWEVAVASAHA